MLPAVVTLAVVRDAAVLGDLLRFPISPLPYLAHRIASIVERMALRWVLPLALVVCLVVRPVLVLFPLIAGWARRTLAYAGEFAADAAAAERMTSRGETPRTLASELSQTASRDRRRRCTRGLSCPPARLTDGYPVVE